MSIHFNKEFLEELKEKEFRDAYAVEHVKTAVPFQIRTLRKLHDWTQEQLARVAKTTQTVISRTEDPDYGNFNLNSLLKFASAFDVALLVKFVPFSRLLREFSDTSPASLNAIAFTEEIGVLEDLFASGRIELQGKTRQLCKPNRVCRGSSFPVVATHDDDPI